MTISLERKRTSRGLDVRSFYLTPPTIRDLLSMGTGNWPKPIDLSSALRANLEAARNGAFIGYHAGATYLAGALVITRLLGS